MKKLALSFLFIVFLLSGCVKMDISVDLKKDGSVDNTLIFAMEKSTYDMVAGFGEDPFSDVKSDVETDGYKIEDYDDGEYIGIKAAKTYANVEDFELLNDDTGQFDLDINGKTYKLNGTLDMSSAEAEFAGAEQFIEDFVLTFTLTMPGKVNKHNADRVEGNKLIWDLSLTEPTEISAESSASSATTIILVGGVIAVAAGALYVFNKKKNTPSVGGTGDSTTETTE